jgi:PAS domain S-box-containing protein
MEISADSYAEGVARLPSQAGSMARVRSGGRSRSIRLLPVAAVVLPLLLTASAMWMAWNQAWREAASDMTGTANATAEYARRVLDGMALRLDRAADLLAHFDDAEIRAREAELHAALRRIPAMTGDLRTMHLFAHDRDARSLVSGRLFPVPGPAQSFADREYNQVHRPDDAPALHVSPAYVGAETRRAFFAVSRRRPPHPDRPGYNGVIVASVDIEEAGGHLARFRPQPEDVIALVRRDGAILVRTTIAAPRSPQDRVAPESPLLAALARGDSLAVNTARSTVDGVVRIATIRPVDGWPVAIYAARPRNAVVAAWWRVASAQLAVGLPATGLLLLLALLVRRRDRALAASNEVLERSVEQRTAALAESEARLRRVQEIGRVGGFEIDLGTGDNLRSAEYMRLQGRAAGQVTERHEDWVRRLHPEDRARAERRFLDAIADYGTDRDYAQEYRIIAPDGSVRWISARAEIERDAQGRAIRMVGAHMDVTELRAAREALAGREAKLSAALRGARLGIAEYFLPTRTAQWDARAAEIFGGLGAEHCSPGMAEWLDRVHPDDRAARRQAIQRAVAPGGPDSYDVEFRFRRVDGGWNWVAVHGAVVERRSDGRALHLAGVVQDVTERREAEERQRLMARELDHRARNALAVVLAAVRLAPRTDAAAFARAVEGRVSTLARTHTLLAEGRWTGTVLRTLAEGELAAFLAPPGQAGTAPRVTIHGPPVHLPPTVAQALAMALHELASNAAIHGALSVPQGRVALSWDRSAAEDALHIRWVERDGPAVTEPARQGFGTRLLDATVRDQLGGSVHRVWDPAGLLYELVLPLGRLVAPDPDLG